MILNPSEADTGGDSLSVTPMMKLKMPGAVAVPLKVLPERLVPVGGLPEIENLYGWTPPVALNATETAEFTGTVAGGDPATVSVPGAMLME